MIELSRVINEPEILNGLMFEATKDELYKAISKLSIYDEFKENSILYEVGIGDDWYCIVNSSMRIWKDKCDKVVINKIVSTHAFYTLSYSYNTIGTIETICENGTIKVKNLDSIIFFIQRDICFECKEHVNECKCEPTVFVEKDVNELVNGGRISEIDIQAKNFLVFDKTNELFGKEEEKEVDLKRFEEVIVGLMKTMRMKRADIDIIAKGIVEKEPEISQEAFAYQVLRHGR